MHLVPIRQFQPRTRIFDERDYWAVMRQDIAATIGLILIYVPFITQKGLDRWMPELIPARQRGIRVIVILGEPENWDQRHDPNLPQAVKNRLDTIAGLIAWLESEAVEVYLRRDIHAKFVRFDEDKLWEGSLNFLSHNRTREHVRRSISLSEVREVERRHAMNELPGSKNNRDWNARLLRALINRRERRGLSQAALARKIGVPKATLSRLEAGKLTALQPAFRKAMEAVDMRLVAVPNFLSKRVEAIIEELLKEQKSAQLGTKGPNMPVRK
jgi:DNA-binding XRE family transcriptional regulator